MNSTTSKTREIERMARDLIAEHLSQEWTFTWRKSQRTFGACHYRSRQIFLSLPMAQIRTVDESRQTLLHEIGHALAGHKAGHGPEWMAACKQIGLDNPERLSSMPERAVKELAWKFALVDPRDGTIWHIYFNKPRMSVDRLSAKGRPDTRGKLRYFSRSAYESRWGRNTNQIGEPYVQ
jgi:SprT-like family.